MARFHLSFDYQGAHLTRSVGSQVVIADTLDEAVRRIATERGLQSIHVRKRFSLGQPASAAELIDREFSLERTA